MKLLIRAITLILGLAIASSALAESPDMVDLATQIQNTSLTFYTNIQGLATNLLLSLFGITFTLKTIHLVLRRAEFQEVVVSMVKMILALGTYVLLIRSGDYYLKTILEGAKYLATTGTGLPNGYFNPSDIMSVGIDLQDNMVRTFNAATGADGFIGSITNFLPAMVLMIGCLIILFAFAMIAINLFLGYCEAYLIIAVAPVMFALGGTEWTKDSVLKPFQSMIAVSLKIIVCAIIGKIAIEAAPLWQAWLATWTITNWKPLFEVAFQILGLGILALWAPSKLASAVLNGGSGLSASDAVQTAGHVGSTATGVAAVALGGVAAAAGGGAAAAKSLAAAGTAAGMPGTAREMGSAIGKMMSGNNSKVPVPGLKDASSMPGATKVPPTSTDSGGTANETKSSSQSTGSGGGGSGKTPSPAEKKMEAANLGALAAGASPEAAEAGGRAASLGGDGKAISQAVVDAGGTPAQGASAALAAAQQGDSLPDPNGSQGDASGAQVSGAGQEQAQLKEAINKQMDMMKKQNPSLAAYSTVIRPPSPRTFGHLVHGDPATDSMSIRPPIPR